MSDDLELRPQTFLARRSQDLVSRGLDLSRDLLASDLHSDLDHVARLRCRQLLGPLAELGDAQAQFDLGRTFEEELEADWLDWLEQDPELDYEPPNRLLEPMLNWFRLAGRQKHPEAMRRLKRHAPSEETLEWTQELAVLGDAESQAEFARDCALNLETLPEPMIREAVRLWLPAAANSDSDSAVIAQCAMGFICFAGKGVEQDTSAAEAWWRRAAQTQSIRSLAREAAGYAALSLASLCMERPDGRSDRVEARFWFLRAFEWRALSRSPFLERRFRRFRERYKF